MRLLTIPLSLATLSNVASIVTAITAVGALALAKIQLSQSDLQEQWRNYSQINARYSELYKDLPTVSTKQSLTENAQLGAEIHRWSKRYFDLTSEEYWLHLNNLLPPQTWECRIAPGVTSNFQEHKWLWTAYTQWKSDAGTAHFTAFTQAIDNLQKELPPCSTR
ncbi:MAG: hypothetical protein IT510_13835 [Sulfuritalea sp.]|nr:hypothetical protein [Sulfuritalea sp.]